MTQDTAVGPLSLRERAGVEGIIEVRRRLERAAVNP
jgi:hypothetical protein